MLLDIVFAKFNRCTFMNALFLFCFFFIIFVFILQDYAESTMNELLGWYGYDNAVDSDDTQDLDLHRFSSSKSTSGAVAASLASLSRLKLAAATAAVQARVAAAAAVKGLGGVVKANRDTPSNGSSDSVSGRPVTTPSPGNCR